MAKRRTKKQKEVTVKRREQITYSLPQINQTEGITTKQKVIIPADKTEQLFKYDTALLYKDLVRTVINSLIIMVILGIFFVYIK